MASGTHGSFQTHETGIEGLLIVKKIVRGDNRGTFQEAFRSDAFTTELGFPQGFCVEQINISTNRNPATRGIHAEPWNKCVMSLGGIVGGFVDLRAGSDTFGEHITVDLEPDTAVMVPNGVGNSYQTIRPDTTYLYMVDQLYDMSLAGKYPAVDVCDPDLGIAFPSDPADTEMSERDRYQNMSFADLRKMGGLVVDADRA